MSRNIIHLTSILGGRPALKQKRGGHNTEPGFPPLASRHLPPASELSRPHLQPLACNATTDLPFLALHGQLLRHPRHSHARRAPLKPLFRIPPCSIPILPLRTALVRSFLGYSRICTAFPCCAHRGSTWWLNWRIVRFEGELELRFSDQIPGN